MHSKGGRSRHRTCRTFRESSIHETVILQRFCEQGACDCLPLTRGILRGPSWMVKYRQNLPGGPKMALAAMRQQLQSHTIHSSGTVAWRSVLQQVSPKTPWAQLRPRGRSLDQWHSPPAQSNQEGKGDLEPSLKQIKTAIHLCQSTLKH